MTAVKSLSFRPNHHHHQHQSTHKQNVIHCCPRVVQNLIYISLDATARCVLSSVAVMNCNVRRTVWSDHPDEDKRDAQRERERVLAMNSNLEIVSVTRYFGSIYRKFRDVRLELSNIGCLFVRAFTIDKHKTRVLLQLVEKGPWKSTSTETESMISDTARNH